MSKVPIFRMLMAFYFSFGVVCCSNQRIRHGEYDKGFKGVDWGTTILQAKPRLLGTIMSEMDCGSRPTCVSIRTEAANPGHINTEYTYKFIDSALTEVFIQLPVDLFEGEEIAAKIVSEYGDPTSKEVSLESPFDKATSMKWQNQSATILLEYGGGMRVPLYRHLWISSNLQTGLAETRRTTLEAERKANNEAANRVAKEKVAY